MRLTLYILAAAMMASPALAAERKPVDCLNNRSIKESRFAPEGYYARTGRDWWLNKAGECGLFRPDRSIATISPLNRQCKGDQIRLFQNFSNIGFGNCILGEWEPVTAEVVPPSGGRKTEK